MNYSVQLESVQCRVTLASEKLISAISSNDVQSAKSHFRDLTQIYENHFLPLFGDKSSLNPSESQCIYMVNSVVQNAYDRYYVFAKVMVNIPRVFGFGFFILSKLRIAIRDEKVNMSIPRLIEDSLSSLRELVDLKSRISDSSVIDEVCNIIIGVCSSISKVKTKYDDIPWKEFHPLYHQSPEPPVISNELAQKQLSLFPVVCKPNLSKSHFSSHSPLFATKVRCRERENSVYLCVQSAVNVAEFQSCCETKSESRVSPVVANVCVDFQQATVKYCSTTHSQPVNLAMELSESQYCHVNVLKCNPTVCSIQTDMCKSPVNVGGQGHKVSRANIKGQYQGSVGLMLISDGMQTESCDSMLAQVKKVSVVCNTFPQSVGAILSVCNSWPCVPVEKAHSVMPSISREPHVDHALTINVSIVKRVMSESISRSSVLHDHYYQSLLSPSVEKASIISKPSLNPARKAVVQQVTSKPSICLTVLRNVSQTFVLSAIISAFLIKTHVTVFDPGISRLKNSLVPVNDVLTLCYESDPTQSCFPNSHDESKVFDPGIVRAQKPELS